MAAPNAISSGVGFRNCQILALDSAGIPAATSTTVYEGVQVSGARAMEIAIPDAPQINHLGDDRIFAVDSLPPTESVGGTLTTGKNNFTLDALLTGATVATVGETKFLGRATNLAGSEVQVCLLAYRQALDTTPGASRVRLYQSVLLPIAQLLPKIPAKNANPEEMQYTIRPQVVSKYPWGVAFATGTEGFTEAQIIEGISYYKPKLVAWKGNASATAFSLPTAAPATATTKMTVWTWNGTTATDVTSTVTLAVGSVTFSVAPSAATTIICYYEHNAA